jgi:hypothetical protein
MPTIPRMPLALRRIGGAFVAATAALALVPALAHAGPLVASAPDCDAQQLDQTFLRFLDPALYTLAHGGTFEQGASGWSLTGGAQVVAGSEPFDLDGTGHTRSLKIPAGATATSPVVCVGLEHPTVRFAARNTGSLLAPLAVSVNVETAFGDVLTLPVGVVVGGSAWAASLPLPVVANLLPLLPGDQTPVSFTFSTPLGGSWQIDGVHVDPFSKN